jgi:hypothetical protein
MPSPDVTRIIRNGRAVLSAHPTIGLDANSLLHALDQLSSKERIEARAYLLHVYGLTVGITTPSQVPEAALVHWAPPVPEISRPVFDLDSQAGYGMAQALADEEAGRG